MTIDVADASTFLVQGSLQPDSSCQFPNDAVVPTTGLNWNVAQEVAVQPATCQALFVRGWSLSNTPPVADFAANSAALAPLTSSSGSSRHDTDLTMWTWWQDPVGQIVNYVGTRLIWWWNGSDFCSAIPSGGHDYWGANKDQYSQSGWQNTAWSAGYSWPDCYHYSATARAIFYNGIFCPLILFGAGSSTYAYYEPNQITAYPNGTANIHSYSYITGGCTFLLHETVWVRQYVDGKEVRNGPV